MEFWLRLAVAVSLVAVVTVSGCTVPAGGNNEAGGVKVLSFGPDIEKVYPGEIVKFRVRFQNTGSVKAENVFAELLGLDQDWYNDGFVEGGPWTKGGEKLPDQDECKYTSSNKMVLLPKSGVFGTGGEIGACSWTYKAPKNVQRDFASVYPVTARVFYSYRSEVVKIIPALSREEFLMYRNRGERIPLGEKSRTVSPVILDIEAETPVRLLEDGERVEFPVTIRINNAGGGTACVTQDKNKGCKKAYSEWNKVKIKVDAGDGVKLGECENLRNGKEIDLYKGKSNEIKCYMKIKTGGGSGGVSERRITVSAEYSYFVDAESSVTVGY